MPRWLLVALIGITIAACDKDAPQKEAPAPQASSTPQAAKKPQPKLISIKQLSKLVETEEDFEAEAYKEITTDRLEAEITKIEAELAAE